MTGDDEVVLGSQECFSMTKCGDIAFGKKMIYNLKLYSQMPVSPHLL